MEPVELLFSCTRSAWVGEKVSTSTPDQIMPALGRQGVPGDGDDDDKKMVMGMMMVVFRRVYPTPDVKVGGLSTHRLLWLRHETQKTFRLG